jgi:anti-sigma B factor antagonist
MTQRTSKLLVESVQDVTVISFLENSILDASQITDISSELHALIEDKQARKMVFDFEQVRFLSSQALGMLITLQKRLDAAGGTLKVAAMRNELRQVFTITKLDRLFKFFPDVETALREFGVASQSA